MKYRKTEDTAHRIVQRERRGVRMSRAAASKGKKKGGVSFTIDCSKPVDDKIMEIAKSSQLYIISKAGFGLYISLLFHSSATYTVICKGNLRGRDIPTGPFKELFQFLVEPVDDNIMEIVSLEKFLQERIKVGGGKAGTLGDSVSITPD
ncbi:hypothetical protein IGI04_008831 [Brassica rapa subsp. trilocularis]|uniref:Uncharacterized protein n=1 Tax=Brassica rapa subsp. trilocularis TaxID=1813537 RepID=A0ABQ7MVQ5_BRACM|nr:hypothetical protein IGI04_008831 [Brassica rapa subsp. trilocularis]